MQTLRSVLLASLALSLGASAAAQTLYATDPAFVHQQVGGSNPCGDPHGPYQNSFGTGTMLCGTLGPIPSSFSSQLGDVAVDRKNDRVFLTDGTTIAVYSAPGTVLMDFTLATVLPAYHGQITGLGFDGTAGLLWVTNGTRAAAIVPPASCFGFIAVAHDFLLPAPFAPYLDLDWHPQSGTLFLAGAAGNVVNLFPGGAFGPHGFNALTLAPTLVTPYTGLAIDASNGGAGWVLYLTDGLAIERVEQGFGFTPTFHWPSKSAAVVFPGTSGLAWTAHGLTFGVAGGGLPPTLVAVGNSVVPNPSFAVRVQGGSPGHVALVFYSFGTFCPAPPFLNGHLYINAANQVGVGALGAGGSIDIAVPIPPTATVPATIYSQGFVWNGSTFHATNGISLALSRP